VLYHLAVMDALVMAFVKTLNVCAKKSGKDQPVEKEGASTIAPLMGNVSTEFVFVMGAMLDKIAQPLHAQTAVRIMGCAKGGYVNVMLAGLELTAR